MHVTGWTVGEEWEGPESPQSPPRAPSRFRLSRLFIANSREEPILSVLTCITELTETFKQVELRNQEKS